jgi:hypothetical protein
MAGLRDWDYVFHLAIFVVIATGFWLLALAGSAVWFGYRSEGTLVMIMVLALVLGIASGLWVSFNRKT